MNQPEAVALCQRWTREFPDEHVQVIVDLMLPLHDAYGVARYRTQTSAVPVMLSYTADGAPSGYYALPRVTGGGDR